MIHTDYVRRSQAEKRGEASALSLHCRNCDLPANAHFYPRLAGSHLAAIIRADDCFCRLQFWLIFINIQQLILHLDNLHVFKILDINNVISK